MRTTEQTACTEGSQQGEQRREGVTKREEETGKVPGMAKEERPEKVESAVMSKTRRVALARGGERRQTDETSGKGKGKGNGGKGRHGGKGGVGSRGARQAARQTEEDERVQVAPNMEAGGSHPQAMMDPGEEEGKRKKEEMGGLR